MDSNEKSGFQARELKSVFVDSITLLLKIVFHRCYVNKYNLYNQVGIVAINCIGELYKANSTGNANKDFEQAVMNGEFDNIPGSIANIEDELSMDKNTLETLKALYAAKERAA